MSDTQRDREERQHVIEVLKSWDGYFIGYTSDEVQEALRYAIASIETDLRYDLLYEETSGQADKSTSKNDLGVELISKEQTIDRVLTYFNHIDKGNDDEWAKGYEAGEEDAIAVIESMPSVTPQLSSGLEKNSKKLENPTTKNDLVVDCISRAEAIKCLECDFDITGKENMKTVVNYINSAHDKIVNLPPVTPQEPKTGHWIPIDEEPHEDYECDNCGYICSSFPTNIDPNEEYKYCPNCGARMIEPQESEA